VEGEGIPNYSDEAEATKRYPDFKKCVQNVIKFNSESDSAEFEVNFFCDMSDEEKGTYASNNFGGGEGGFGLGLGSSGQTNNQNPNSIIMQIFGEKFKIPEPSVTNGLTTDSLTLPDCTTAEVYNSEEVLAQIDEEKEYLCAFIAFQINKVQGEGIPNYSNEAEATKRYPLFKKCVDYVNKLNSETTKTEFGVNFFCDMTTDEKKPFNGGDYSQNGEGLLGSGYDGGNDVMSFIKCFSDLINLKTA
jgi:hypothetical protein